MVRTTRHARTTREHPRVVVTCAYADPLTERLRARLRLRVTPLQKDPHAPFVIVEFENGATAGGTSAGGTSAGDATSLSAVAGDKDALRAFVRKVLDRP